MANLVFLSGPDLPSTLGIAPYCFKYGTAVFSTLRVKSCVSRRVRARESLSSIRWPGQPKLDANLAGDVAQRQQAGAAKRVFLERLASPCADPFTTFADLAGAVQCDGPTLPVAVNQPLQEYLGSVGLAAWDEVCARRELVLHPATVAAMDEAATLGYIAVAHQPQGSAKLVVFPDGSHVSAPGN